MGKQILLVRIDVTFFTEEQMEKLKKEFFNVQTDYHVICTSVGAPRNNFSLECFGGCICNTDALIKRQDVLAGISKRING